MKPILTYLEQTNRRREYGYYGAWIYDNTYHIPKTYKHHKWGEIKMLCGFKVGSYALNTHDFKVVNCPKCKEAYKKGKR